MPTCVEFVAPSVVKQTPSQLASPVAVAQLAGVDAAIERALRARGVVGVEQLRRLPKPVLVAAFGDSVGRQLWASARGLDGPKRTFWTEMRSGVARLWRWLATSPKTSTPAATVAISSPDTAKA